MTAPTQRHALFARRRRRWPSDLLEPTLPSRQLYESAELLDFIREVLHAAVLYRSADPLDGAQVTRFDPGDELGWHFDNSDYSVTLMLQAPDYGGDFEFHPALRSDDYPNTAGVLCDNEALDQRRARL